MQKQAQDELGKILTDAQKARLKEILVSRVPGGEGAKDDKKRDDKKGSGDKK